MEPRIVVNGVTGERIVFGEYGADGEGTFLRLDEFSLPAGSAGPEEHRHLLGDERFEVVEGRLGIRIDDEEFVLGPGESTTVPAGARHVWWNADDTTVVGRGELRNPGRIEEMITTFFALANRGTGGRNGQPGLLQSAVVLAEYAEEYDLSTLPRPVKLLVISVLAPLGRALGHPVVVPYVPPSTPATAEPIATT
jgi:mannose-6-phosphate isomerase-like protein (cupin superfamily)